MTAAIQNIWHKPLALDPRQYLSPAREAIRDMVAINRACSGLQRKGINIKRQSLVFTYKERRENMIRKGFKMKAFEALRRNMRDTQ